MKNKIYSILILVLLICGVPRVFASLAIPMASRQKIARTLTRMTGQEVAQAWVTVDRLFVSKGRVKIYASIGLSYFPFRTESVKAMYDSVRVILPSDYQNAKVEIYTDDRLIEELVPLAYRHNADRKKINSFTNRSERPLVTPLSQVWSPSAGLRNRHIALSPGHGRYFDQLENRWRWQREARWLTCEDLYTMSYVLPFLTPMLERAGANVLLPRERDVQMTEMIVDNDPSVGHTGHYAEIQGVRPWRTAGVGFAHSKYVYRSGENPFALGTVRVAESVTSGAESSAVWSVDLPEAGEYALYVAYKTMSNSAPDATYTVRHMGGESRYAVNQTMGGGTWIYLGTFHFAEGAAHVTLSNRSVYAGRVVTADAVKIGGGMGNIARTVCDSLRRKGVDYIEQVSGMPRFCEGSRYWLQWAGFNPDVYTPKSDKDDYRDDYMSRAHWVNALMGGSERLPAEKGLGIPIDVALALHSDSGVRDGDKVVGTLGIFYTKENRGQFEGDADRYLSRDLAEMVASQVVNDVRATFEPHWVRRELWNRSYYEARVAAAPTMMLEMLSHQNFADMRYGLDPRFRFVVSRAIYKAILRHVSAQYNTPYIVQPLAVESFSAELVGEQEVYLRWRPTADPLEPTATPNGYVLYTRNGNGAFDNGRLIDDTSCTVTLKPDVVYSFKIAAVNDGGESFPSEILSACRVSNAKGRVLVVNGFDRVSGPHGERTDSLAGFGPDLDSGVPYMSDVSFVGQQRVFDLAMARSTNSSNALGVSEIDYATEVVGGNIFDYPYLHGVSIVEAGWSFCSTSVKAVEQGDVNLYRYDVVDLILGKQRSIVVGRGERGYEFTTFTTDLQRALRGYISQGGALLVSGSYVLTDLWAGGEASQEGRNFAREVLHCDYGGSRGANRGHVLAVASPAGVMGGDYRFNTELRPECYAVEFCDALLPFEGAFATLCYASDGAIAGVAYEGAGRTFVVGFPFEAINQPLRRNMLMRDALRFLDDE